MSTVINKFKNNNDYESRINESSRIISKFLGNVPIICQKLDSDLDCPEIAKNKFLVNKDLTFGQFRYILRKYIKLKPEQTLFVFVEDVIPPVSMTISQIYNEHKDSDGFTYLYYSLENTFGC